MPRWPSASGASLFLGNPTFSPVLAALVEELFQEAPTLLLMSVAVLLSVTVLPVDGVLVRVVVPVTLRLLRVRLLRRVWLLVLLAGRTTAVPRALRADEPLQLTPVQEDPPALGALVDGDATALVLSHLAHAFGTCHLLHQTTVMYPLHYLVDLESRLHESRLLPYRVAQLGT
jgi:hypothetical protein